MLNDWTSWAVWIALGVIYSAAAVCFFEGPAVSWRYAKDPAPHPVPGFLKLLAVIYLLVSVAYGLTHTSKSVQSRPAAMP